MHKVLLLKKPASGIQRVFPRLLLICPSARFSNTVLSCRRRYRSRHHFHDMHPHRSLSSVSFRVSSRTDNSALSLGDVYRIVNENASSMGVKVLSMDRLRSMLELSAQAIERDGLYSPEAYYIHRHLLSSIHPSMSHRDLIDVLYAITGSQSFVLDYLSSGEKEKLSGSLVIKPY